MRGRGSSQSGFTLIELLVVIAVIALLMAIIVPALHRVRFRAYETSCLSNLRQISLAMATYSSDDSRTRYWLEETEHNSHRNLLTALKAYRDSALMKAFYCPQAGFMEQIANDPNGGVPTGGVDTVIDTPENRELGNITYIYWSFRRNKIDPVAGATWRDPVCYLPRELTGQGLVGHRDWLGATNNTEAQDKRYQECTSAAPADIWVVSDFFRKKGVFPHGRKAGSFEGGVNVNFLDGHAGRVYKSPKDSYR